MIDPLVLGIDIGTASAKGVLATPAGEVVATAAREHTLSLPRPGWAEHDAESVWWEGVLALCCELVPAAGGRLAGVCVSGIGPCVVPCDAAVRPLRPAILYGIDTRATEEAAELEDRLGADAILARGGSVLSSQALGPKLLWLRRHDPEIWSRTAAWHMASSFAVARLTGEYVLDHHSASQCDPLYDMAAQGWAQDWATEICGDVPLPRLAWPAEVVGTVHAEGAEATGIPVGTPVMAGTIDAWAEAFSVGVRRAGDLMVMYGSTMFLVEVADAADAHPGLWLTAGVEPGSRSLAAGMATSGSLTAWLRDLMGNVDYGQLVREAADSPPGSHGLVVLPYFAGERSPLFDPDARGIIAGLTLSHTRGDLFRAVYEAIGYGVRHILETFATAGASPRRVVAVGGGTQGDLWTQVVSDICRLHQTVPEQTIGAAYGDSLLAAIGSGLVAAETDWTRKRAEVEPREAGADAYDELYDVYRRLHLATTEIQHALSDLARRGQSPPARA